MNSVIFITARMGSARFPGKALALLAGKPMLQWVAERCAATGFPVYLAIPPSRENDALADAAPLLAALKTEEFMTRVALLTQEK